MLIFSMGQVCGCGYCVVLPARRHSLQIGALLPALLAVSGRCGTVRVLRLVSSSSRGVAGRLFRFGAGGGLTVPYVRLGVSAAVSCSAPVAAGVFLAGSGFVDAGFVCFWAFDRA